MKNEPHLIFPTFNDQIHIVLQYIDIFQRMLHINKKQSDGTWSRDEVPSGGWVWEGGIPPPYSEENWN